MTRGGRTLTLAVLGAVVLVVGPLAGSAAAHGGDAAVASNYRTRILSVEPPMEGIDVRVIDVGGRLELSNRTATEVVILGYQGEPYLRVGPDGVFENQRSPATYLNLNRDASAPIPPDADAEAAPKWERLSGGQVVRWHDHRAHWMGTQPPPAVQAAPGVEHIIYPAWQVPFLVGKSQATITGDLAWVPGPSRWPWLGAAGVLLVGLTVALRSPAWRWVALAALVGAVAIDVAASVGYFTGSPDSLGNRSMILVYTAVGALALWRFVVQLRRGIDHPPFSMLVGGLTLLLIGGVDRLEVLHQSQLVFAFPSELARLSVTTSLGVGAALVLRFILQLRARQPEAEPHLAVEPHG